MIESFFLKKAGDLALSLGNTLRELRENRREEIREIERIFGSIDYLAPYYVIPDSQNVNPADLHEDDTGLVARNSVFELLEQFLAGPPRFSHAFILSDAGMGKTSLLVMLKLFHLNKFIRPRYKIVLFKLDHDTLDSISQTKDPANTVLLLDALDEDPEAWQQFYGRLQHILQATSNFRKTLITCRTQFFPKEHEEDGRVPGQVKLSGFYCSKLFLSPFSDQQVSEYINKRFTDESKREKARTIVQRMESLKFRPMLLSYIDFLLEYQRTFRCAYDIYEALVEEWFDRELRKGIVKNKKALRNVCSAIAVRMYETKQREMPYHDLRDFYLSAEGGRELEYMSVEGRSLLQRTSEGAFKFAHYSILEFFVASELAAKQRPFENTDQVKSFIADMILFRGIRCGSGLDLSRVHLPEAKFRSLNLSNSNFSGAILTGSDLRYAKLRNSILTGADLTGSRMEVTDLVGAKMRSSILRKCHLQKAKLQDVELKDCVLDGSDLSEADIRGTIFEGSSLVGVKFDHTEAHCINLAKGLLTSASFRGALLPEANFSQAEVSNSNFETAELINGNFRAATLCRAQCQKANFDKGQFENSDLSEANLTEAQLSHASFRKAKLTKAVFNNCRGMSTNFSETDLEDAEFVQAELDDATFSKSKLNGSSFKSATLPGSVFNSATGEDVNFRSANLSRVDFSNAILRRCRFDNADLTHASFMKVDLRGASFGSTGEGESPRFRVNGTHVPLSDELGLVESLGLVQCSMSESKFSRIELIRCDLSRSEILESTWELVKIDGGDFSETNLRGSRFLGCIIENSNFSKAVVSAVTFENCQLINCTWRDALFDRGTIWPEGFSPEKGGLLGPKTIHRNRNLRDLSLRGADLAGADIRKSNLSACDLSGINLSNANLSGCDLEGSDLSGADLANANLAACNLISARLSGAVTKGAKFSKALYSKGTEFPRKYPMKGMILAEKGSGEK